TAQESNTLWGSCEQHGAFPLSFAKDANLLIVLREINITVLHGKSLSHSYPRFIEQGEEDAITQVGGRNSFENLLDDVRLERARLFAWLHNRIKTFHGLALGEFLTNQPPVQGTEGRVASPPCCGAMMSIAIEKDLDCRCLNGRQAGW